jgi:hypothetical protein
MSYLQASSTGSVATWSLAILIAFLALSPVHTARTSEPAGTQGQVNLGAATPSRVASTVRDPSVPVASSVSFPTLEAGESPAETF